MSITKNKPSTLETVGDQFITFSASATDDWDGTFDESVSEYPTVTTIEVTDNTDSYSDYASGKIYESDAPVTTKDIAVTNLAFDTKTLEKMKGSVIDGGVILSGGNTQRPYFAYGVDVINKDGTHEYRWYPKCMLTENDDKAETREESHKSQTKQLTIRAYGYDDDGHIEVKCLTSESGFESVTAEKFFAKPLLTVADVKALASTATEESK